MGPLSKGFGRAASSSVTDVGPNEDIIRTCAPNVRMAFNTAAWNRDGKLRYRTNCYTYALNCPESGWSIPGFLALKNPLMRSGKLFRAKYLKDALRADGLVEISEHVAMSGTVHAVALTIAPGDDFHFWRRDADGQWSEKMGDAPVSNIRIDNPRLEGLTDRYNVFGGYFMVPGDGVKYRQRLHVPEKLLKNIV